MHVELTACEAVRPVVEGGKVATAALSRPHPCLVPSLAILLILTSCDLELFSNLILS